VTVKESHLAQLPFRRFQKLQATQRKIDGDEIPAACAVPDKRQMKRAAPVCAVAFERLTAKRTGRGGMFDKGEVHLSVSAVREIESLRTVFLNLTLPALRNAA